jgi:hypothetical protein
MRAFPNTELVRKIGFPQWSPWLCFSHNSAIGLVIAKVGSRHGQRFQKRANDSGRITRKPEVNMKTGDRPSIEYQLPMLIIPTFLI